MEAQAVGCGGGIFAELGQGFLRRLRLARAKLGVAYGEVIDGGLQRALWSRPSLENFIEFLKSYPGQIGINFVSGDFRVLIAGIKSNRSLTVV